MHIFVLKEVEIMHISKKEVTCLKEKYSKKSVCLIEGARRIGKSTVALEFAKNQYVSNGF